MLVSELKNHSYKPSPGHFLLFSACHSVTCIIVPSLTCPLGGISELFSAVQKTQCDTNSGAHISRLKFNKISCPNICFGHLITIITRLVLSSSSLVFLVSAAEALLLLMTVVALILGGSEEETGGSIQTSRDLPSQLLLRYTDTNTGGTVKKSTTEFTSSQNHSLSFAAINWGQEVTHGRNTQTLDTI